ncbi:MAG: hypothetical protein J5779_00880, partial [Clostridia bacterium]|nr:hypothetical protein [Clostridia bacterium]
GQESQDRMMIEEMSELTKELCKKIRLERDDFSEKNDEKLQKTIQNVKEKIADVLNMAEQLEIYYGTEEIEKIREEKMERTMKLLGEVK